jgi:anti-anti-sigma factor
MAIETRLSNDDTVLVIGINGPFDFSLLNEFRQAYSKDEYQTKNITIDMRRTSTIDSSALGMLLNMQRYLKKKDREINIINCGPVVLKVFQITHFNEKFTIK